MPFISFFILKIYLSSKLPRDKSKPGKGSFWTIDQTVGEMFEKGNYRRRKRRARMVMEKMMREKVKMDMELEHDAKKKLDISSNNPYSIERILSM